ncbi:hypothetical protein [Rubritalea marina]|uniref:hypothetical protein n=1 Tax=Rubritalea marina TaxID=361055 RepID=UPI00037A3D82|nr:hypothetical protein [Rubritalea marina]
MKLLLPLLGLTCLSTPLLANENPTLKPLSIEIATPAPIWQLEIIEVYQSANALILIAKTSQPNDTSNSAGIVGKAIDQIELPQELLKLPRKLYVYGQTWEDSEGYTVITESQIPEIIKGATLVHQSKAKPNDTDFIGLSIEDAQALSKKHELRCRVIEVDGKPRPMTLDLRPDRLNFHVKDGKVTKVTRG